ncbi:MAG: hypothetical protein IJM30_09870 [Thermoguttaceae bacterium]|nr:hypothetical protein [Thermoguttaceae bacterium]
MKRRISFSLSIAALALCAFGANLFAQEERRPENESLLETIKIEAANMEVFPVDMIANSTKGAVYQKANLARQERLGKNCYIPKWGERRELTFERYLPFYRFKTRVGLASPEEIDECVDEFYKLTVREKALAITAIFIFERVRRRPFKDEHKLTPNGSYAARFPFFPYYPIHPYRYDYISLLLPKYVPNEAISKEKWEKWNATIENCLGNKEIAFPEVDSLLNPTNFPANDAASVFDEDNRDQWTKNLEHCLNLVKLKLNVEMSVFGQDTLSFDNSREFLQKVDKLETDSSRSKYDLVFALRDYWFTFQNDEEYWNIRRGQILSLRNGNSSFVPKTLGDIADQLLKSRLEYEPSEPIQTP